MVAKTNCRIEMRRPLTRLSATLSMNLSVVGSSRCDDPAHAAAGGIVAPLNAARTAQRAVPTRFRGSMRECFRGNLSPSDGEGEGVMGHSKI